MVVWGFGGLGLRCRGWGFRVVVWVRVVVWGLGGLGWWCGG